MKPASALVLFPPDGASGDVGDLEGAAAAADLAVTRVRTPGELLLALRGAEAWKLILVSLRTEGVDRSFLAQVRAMAPVGARVATSAPGMTLDRAILVREAGGGPLVQEPLDANSLSRFREPEAGLPGGLQAGPPVAPAEPGYAPTRSLEEVERDHIARVLRHTGGVMGEAAEILGIHRNTLTRKVDQYRLREELEPGDPPA